MINVCDIVNRNLDPGNVIWRHYQTCRTPELEVKSGILKEMLMLGDSNQEQIFNKLELEPVGLFRVIFGLFRVVFVM